MAKQKSARRGTKPKSNANQINDAVQRVFNIDAICKREAHNVAPTGSVAADKHNAKTIFQAINEALEVYGHEPIPNIYQ